nr:uncharacterized protein LOC119174475 [Rhipicephalus microplus]
MGKRKWNVLHSRLKVLTKLEIKALKKENQSWLSSLKTIPLDDPSAIADAIMKAVADKRGTECRRRAAWLYCWLLTERLPDVLWTLLANEDENENDNKDGNKDGNVDKVNYKNGGVRDEQAAFEACAEKMTTSKQAVNVQWVINNGAIYACMLAKGGTSGPNGIKKIYLVMSRNRKLLAAKRVGGPLQNNLNHALTEAFPKFRIKTGFLESEDIDRVLLEGVHLKKRIARELKDSRAKGSATEQSADNSADEDSADEDSADEDGTRKGGAHEDGTDEEPADEDYTSKEDGSDSSLQYSSLEDSLRVEPVRKESSPDTMQEVVKPGSSNNRKQSRRARATKKPGPTPVANKDSQPGSSRDSKPWTGHDDQPAGSAENKVDATAARRKRVSTRSPILKLEHRPKKGVPSEKPEDGDIKEPDEVDPKAVYQDALKEVEGLESIINKLNSGKIYIGRSHEIEVRKLCLALHEFCSRKARNPDVRKRMLDAVRHELSISCPLFVWEEVEFSAPVEQPLQDTGKKTPKKQSERKKKTKQGTSAKKVICLCNAQETLV